jgi:ribosomal protein S2
MPFLGFTGTRLQQLKKELRKIRRMKGSPRIITVFELRQPYNAIQTNAKTMRTSRGRR